MMRLEAYTSSLKLAKDICFAMVRAYGTSNVSVTEIKDYGWHVDCDCKSESIADHVKAMLGKSSFKVNWL